LVLLPVLDVLLPIVDLLLDAKLSNACARLHFVNADCSAARPRCVPFAGTAKRQANFRRACPTSSRGSTEGLAELANNIHH
jgi:hypothetical protein